MTEKPTGVEKKDKKIVKFQKMRGKLIFINKMDEEKQLNLRKLIENSNQTKRFVKIENVMGKYL